MKSATDCVVVKVASSLILNDSFISIDGQVISVDVYGAKIQVVNADIVSGDVVVLDDSSIARIKQKDTDRLRVTYRVTATAGAVIFISLNKIVINDSCRSATDLNTVLSDQGSITV